MRLAGSLLLALLWAFTSGAAGFDIPLIVEQPPTIISHSPSPVVALPFDNTHTIRCEAKGNPPLQYRWTKDGEDFDFPNESTIKTDNRNGTFMFHNKHFVQFQGKYRCFASNKLGTAMTEEIDFIVPGSPKFPKETIDPIYATEGEPIMLHCNPPKGVSPRLIYWMTIGLHHIEQDERVSMGTNGDLYFANALLNDTRSDYCCFAAFPRIRMIVQKTAMAIRVKKSADGVPARAPSLLLPSGVQSQKVLLKGEDLQLECIPGGLPTPSITWIKMGESLTDRIKLANFNRLLSITNVDENDRGKYMCTAENSAGKAVHYFDVTVEEPPTWITEPPQNQLTVVGSEVVIKCSVSGKPPPVITWRRNGKVFRDDPLSSRRVLDDTVMIHKAGPKDSAVYQCEASNNHGTILANINVLVMNMAPLMLTNDSLEYAVIVGDDVIMDCSVFSSPPSDISWSKEEAAINGERFLVSENGQSLKIISTEKGDSGKFVCVASNTEGMSALTAVLKVKDPTKIVGPPQDVQNISGTSARLLCRAECDESLRDTFEVMWRKDGEEISLSSEEGSRYIVNGGLLQIMNVNLRDQGTYTCIAKTSLDEDSASALLTVLDVPDAPTMLKISDVKSERNIVLSWIPGSDHNSSITEFVVEYEENHWEPGRWKELQKAAGNQRTAELFLHGNLKYQFRVFAVNAVGPGPPSEPTERYSTPPGAPDKNPENIKIEGHLPDQMDISWDPLLPTEHNGPGFEYNVTYRKLGVEDDWKEVLVQQASFTVKNTPTFIPYEIKVQSRNSFGSGPEPKSVTGYSGEDVPTAAPRDVAVEVINTTAVRVSWTPVPPATVRGHLGGYNVHWLRMKSLLNADKILNQSSYTSFPGNRSHVIVLGLEPFSVYKLTVNVFNKKGKGPKSDPVTFNTPEGVPEPVPILTTSKSQEDSVLLVWGPPPVTNGFLSGYLLQYHLLNETSLEVIESQETNITGPDITQWQLSGLKDGSLYRFHLSACTRAGCGPPQAQESKTDAVKGGARHGDGFSTQSWLIGTLCAVALLTLVVVTACFVLKNKGGKYAVKEKEDLYPDAESQRMNDDPFFEYSDYDEKPLKRPSEGDSSSGDSMVDYADGEVEFNEDGSFIGEYSGPNYKGPINEPNGPSSVTA